MTAIVCVVVLATGIPICSAPLDTVTAQRRYYEQRQVWETAPGVSLTGEPFLVRDSAPEYAPLVAVQAPSE